MTSTRPVFVRLPEEQALQLDHACYVQGMTKQAFVRTALANHLGGATSDGSANEFGRRDDVLTLDELVSLLRVEVEVVRRRVEAGELPGRRFGDDWRFSRHGVMAWLATSEDHGRRAAGSEAPRVS